MSGTQVKTNCFSRSYSDLWSLYYYGYDLIKIGEDLIRDNIEKLIADVHTINNWYRAGQNLWYNKQNFTSVCIVVIRKFEDTNVVTKTW